MPSVRSVLEYVATPGDPWVIVGKGPSLTYDAERALRAGWRTFVLNHACLFVKSDVSHFTDLEAYRDIRFACWSGSVLCLPWYPHVRFRPSRSTLARLADDDEKLGVCRANGKLLSYNSTVASNLPRNPALPTIRVRHFSGVAAFNIMAAAGVRRIYTVGIDCGKGYSPLVNPKDKLANGRVSFDSQHAEIVRACKRYGATWVRLDAQSCSRPPDGP